MDILIEVILDAVFDIAEGAFKSSEKSKFQRGMITAVFIAAQVLTLFLIYACFARLVEGLWYAVLIAVTAAVVAGWAYIFIKAIRKRKQ